MYALAGRASPTDVVAVANALGPDLARIEGHIYLHSCIEAVPTAANGPYYAQIIKSDAVRWPGAPPRLSPSLVRDG